MLGLVLTDHIRLDLAAALDGVCQRSRIKLLQQNHVLLQPAEEISIPNDAVLDHLGHPCGKFAGGQGRETLGIDNNLTGLVKGSDHVLAKRVVDGSFTAHRGVNLG